ncbi:MAG: minor capsid protein [Thermoguttaceae bacterium]|nr:minor capsid protein [Thermoguttaceae bacterium]
MRKNQLAAQKAVSRDLTAIALPTRLPLKRIIALLQDLTFQALKTGNTKDIEKVCQKQLLELLDANTEVAVLKGGRRGQLSAEKVIDEPVQEIMPVRLSLEDSGSIQAQGTAAYLKRISGIDPSEANNAFKRQNAVLIRGLSTEICDTIRKTIADLTKQGVHVKGGKQEIANILMNAGLDPAAAPRLAETIFRTQTAAAYNAGRWNIVNDPDTAPYIWGFEYCTAHDRRVRPEHRLLEGVRLPKDDPFWKKYLPPNGWNCRCTVLEIWNDEDIAKVDFGITGVDPRKRTDKELNLLPAFAGNAGVLAAGRKYTKKQDEPKTPEVIPPPPPPAIYTPIVFNAREIIREVNRVNDSGTKTLNLIVDERAGGKEFVIKSRNGDLLAEILQRGISFDQYQKNWRIRLHDGTVIEAKDIDEAFLRVIEAIARKRGITPREVLLSFKRKAKISTDSIFPDDPNEVAFVEQLGDTTEAVQDDAGNMLVKKTLGKERVEHVENGVRADNFYRSMGIDVPECRIYRNPDGSVVKLAQFIEGGTTLEKWWQQATQYERRRMRKRLLRGFAVDIILNARGVIGEHGSHILVDKDGKPWRINNGGTMGFSSQGAKHTFEDWERGFPDELLTMTDKNLGADKRKYFGSVSMLEAVALIAERSQAEWDKAIAELPPKDAKVVRKRLDECLQLAERGQDLTANDFTNVSANSILEKSYELSKDGFREAVPDELEFNGSDVSDYKYFRAEKKKPRPAGLCYSDVWDDIELACKTINEHNAVLGDKKPDQATIDAARKHKKYLQAKVRAGDKDAKIYLDYIKQIEAACKKGMRVPLFVPVTTNDKPTIHDSCSLTDWLHTRIREHGGDPQFIVKWQYDQATDSYEPNACIWKIIKGICIGIDISQEEDKIINDFRDRGFYVGDSSLGTGRPADHERNIRGAIQRVKSLSKDDVDTLVRTAEEYIAGVQLILENCDFPGNDKSRRTVICGRTESDVVIPTGVLRDYQKTGMPVISTHKTGVAESHFVKTVVAVYGYCLTSVRVPYARISGLYFCEREAASNHGCFLDDSENELNATTNGLTILYQGRVSGGEDFESYRNAHETCGY